MVTIVLKCSNDVNFGCKIVIPVPNLPCPKQHAMGSISSNLPEANKRRYVKAGCEG
jgi:hypothetical protein